MEPRPDQVGAAFLPGPAAEAAQAEREGYLLTSALSQRLDLIRHLIDFSRQIVLVVGEEGSGKTSLLHHLLATAPDNWRLAKINADPMCDADAVMKRLSADFDLHFTDKDSIEKRIESFDSFLGTMRRALLVPVVLVDDAHLLPADALLLLLHLAHPESVAPHLRVTLFCDPRISRLLGSPQLHAFKDSLTHTVEMAPFTIEDSANYLAAHWPSADAESSPILDERFVREVHAAAGGIPGRINVLVRTSLEEPTAVAEANAPVPPRLRPGFSLAGGVLALLIAIGAWLLHRGEVDGERTRIVVVEPAPIEVAPSVPMVPPVVTGEDFPAAGSPAATPVLPVNTARSAPREQPAATVPQAPTPAVSGTQAAPVPLGDLSPSSAPTAAVTPSPTSATKSEEPRPAATETERRPSDEAKPRTTERKAAAKPVMAKAADDWLQRQPKRNYVVQLYATYQRASAQQFIASHSLAAKANIIATVRDDKTWYVVVYGSYRDRTKAKAAISGLPVAVQQLKPWVRQVGDLQAVAAP